MAFDLATRDHQATGHTQSIGDRLAALVSRQAAPLELLTAGAPHGASQRSVASIDITMIGVAPASPGSRASRYELACECNG